MPFTGILNDILSQIPKAIGIIIVDFEGECVQLAADMDEHELKVIGAYQVINFGAVEKDYGTAKTFITNADNLDIISMRLDDEYYISFVLKKGAVLGQTEYFLKTQLGELRDMIA